MAQGGGRRNETVDVGEQGPRPRGSQRVRSAALSASVRGPLARQADAQRLLCPRVALGSGPGYGGGMEDTRLWSLHPHVPVKGGKQGDPTRSTRSASVRGAQTAEVGGAKRVHIVSETLLPGREVKDDGVFLGPSAFGAWGPDRGRWSARLKRSCSLRGSE